MVHNDSKTTTVTFTLEELEALLDRSAERGAKRALADVGLEGEDAQTDLKELRALLQALHLAKQTAWQTTIRLLTAGVLTALMAGIAFKLKWFGG